jgi:segregation and condensation protein A
MTNPDSAVALEEIAPAAAPIALIRGEAFTQLPKDLYIPPDAMKVLLETFEGPLDLLLYLIRKQNLDILDIPIAAVTRQYMEYIDYMKALSLDLAAEYLVMAATLAEIKSRLLLPQPPSLDQPEEDPRATLVRRLQEYERYKKAAASIDALPRLERDIFTVEVDHQQITIETPLPTVAMQDLVYAFVNMLRQAELTASHHITMDTLSVREKMTHILDRIQHTPHCLFSALFNPEEGRLGVVVNFLAVLELLKEGLIEFIQAAPFGPIYLTPRA